MFFLSNTMQVVIINNINQSWSQIMINECKSLKILQNLSQYSQSQLDILAHLAGANNRLDCEPSQDFDQYSQQLKQEMEQFKKDIEQKYQRSIANKIYTFPKKILSIVDILSSEEGQEEQQNQFERTQKNCQYQREAVKLPKSNSLNKNKSRNKDNFKETDSKNMTNSNSPLKSKYLRTSSTFKKKYRFVTEKSASKSKREGKATEAAHKTKKVSHHPEKQARDKQKQLKQPTLHQFLQTIKNKARKA